MAMEKVNIDNQCCATCINWRGRRNYVGSNYVEFDGNSDNWIKCPIVSEPKSGNSICGSWTNR
jgi:hypothetical protein